MNLSGIARANGFKSEESMNECSLEMSKQGIIITVNRHLFMEGWKACEKYMSEKKK